YISPDSGPLINDIVAAEDSELIFFDINRILSTCPSACPFHSLTLKNLFFAISEKNRKIAAKLEHISQRTTRDKLLSYLSREAKSQGSPCFTIPFNRQQLADFLSVDRSAMCTELKKMQEDGLIAFAKNRFTLMQTEA
ncbi:MAG: helix-turn-helix domain-containing protein, partial [Bacillota bacterium]|nr:helix-turn-helix domain-containing protein [Bacillota bacterium]